MVVFIHPVIQIQYIYFYQCKQNKYYQYYHHPLPQSPEHKIAETENSKGKEDQKNQRIAAHRASLHGTNTYTKTLATTILSLFPARAET